MARVTLGDRLEALAANDMLPENKRQFAASLLAYYRKNRSLTAGRRVWVDRLEAMVEEASNRDPSERSAIAIEIEDVLTRVSESEWAHGFLSSLLSQIDRLPSGRLTARQTEVYEGIKKEYSKEAIDKKAEWAIVYCRDHVEDAKIVAAYYAKSPYFTSAATATLSDSSFVPSESLYNKMCKNKYAMKVLAGAKAEPKYPVGTSVITRKNATRRTALKNGGVVLSVDEPIISAVKGCKRYKVLPYGAAKPVLVEERDIKLLKNKG